MLEHISSFFSYSPGFFSSFQKPSDLLAKSLRENNSTKVVELLEKYPELINIPTSSAYLPIEFALSHKNIPLVQNLLSKGAELNLKMISSKNPSPLDHVILQDDPEVLKGVLGNILGTIFSITHKNIKQASAQTFQNALDRAVEDFTFLVKDAKKYETSNKSLNSALWNLLSYSPRNLLTEILVENKDNFSNLEVFDAMTYGILNHNNDLVQILYEVFGNKILMLQTTDLKNLYHIAAIADNAPIVDKLTSWGLAQSSDSDAASNELGLYSPFHYAMMHTSLNTFIALTHSNLSYPSSLPLSFINAKSIIPNIDKMNLSPSQLFILKAYITDPLPQTSRHAKLYLLLEASIWSLVLAKDLFNYSKTLDATISFVKSTLVIARTSYMCSELYKELSDSFSKGLFHALSKGLYYGSIISLFNNSLEPFLSRFYKPFQILSSTLLIKKVWNDFSSYQKTYFFRPKDTFYKLIENIFSSAIIFRNTVYDYPNFLESAKEKKNWGAFFDSKFKYESQDNYKRRHQRPFWSNPPTGTCSNLFSDKTSITQNLVARISKLTEDIFLCCFKKVETESSYFVHKSSSLIKCLLHAPTSLEDKQERKIYRELNKLLHPDVCGRNGSPLSESFCQKYADQYATQFNEWFKREIPKSW